MHHKRDRVRTAAAAPPRCKPLATPPLVATSVGVAALIYAAISARLMGTEATTIFAMLPICAFFTFEALTSNAEWR